MALADVLIALAVGILGSIAAALLLKHYRHFFHPLRYFTEIGRHARYLEAAIRDMPFIYKDLDSDIINDFVDLDIKTLSLERLSLVPASSILNITAADKLRHSRKIIFLGNAGVGKTTFQRHIIYRLLNTPAELAFLLPGERPIPFFIPLKVLDNAYGGPIFRYLSAYPHLSFSRLKRLAKAGRLFLFLDGYDEIPFANPDKEERNFIREDLDRILGTTPPFSTTPGERAFYESLERCRIWLSSRKEFFEQNPVGVASSGYREHLSPLKALEITGVGQNRLKLVKLIFDKYRRRSQRYANLLSEEYFLQRVDDLEDSEVRRLSYNPLFLTIMCYTYVTKVLASESPDVAWGDTFYEHVLECIHLLLHDVDEWKARELPDLHRRALLKRRNAFVDEKAAFVRFFAFDLFVTMTPLFTIAIIKDRMRSFFSVHPTPQSTRIVAELDYSEASYPNMALQLVYSGIFVIVDASRPSVLYDFPHRRFREVLACEYAGRPESYIEVLRNLDRDYLQEFLKVFFRSPVFREPELHRQTLQKILDGTVAHPGDESWISISDRFARGVPEGVQYSDEVQRFVNRALRDEQPAFALSGALLGEDETKQGLRGTVLGEFVSARRQENDLRFGLCCSLLFWLDRPLLGTLLSEMFREHGGPTKLLLSLIYYALVCRVEEVWGWVLGVKLEEPEFWSCCYALMRARREGLSDDAIAARLRGGLSFEEKLGFLYLVRQRATEDLSAWISILDGPVSEDQLNIASDITNAPGRGSRDGGAVYAAGTGALNSMRHYLVPSWLCRVEQRVVTVRVSAEKEGEPASASYVKTTKEERLYAQLDGEGVREEILRLLEEIKWRRFREERELLEELRRCVVGPFKRALSDTKFVLGQEIEQGILPTKERGGVRLADAVERDLERLATKQVRVDRRLVDGLAHVRARIRPELESLKLPAFFK